MGEFVAADSTVNLSRPPVVCAVHAERPLPVEAWQIVERLARAVEEAADNLNIVLGDVA